MEKKIVKVKVLGVCPDLTCFSINNTTIDCDSSRLWMPLYFEKEKEENKMLYSILICYEDGGRELKDGVTTEEMKFYLPFLSI